MKPSLTLRGRIGLLIGVAGLLYLLAGSYGPFAPAAVIPAAAEEIDVEQSVAFPWDI